MSPMIEPACPVKSLRRVKVEIDEKHDESPILILEFSSQVLIHFRAFSE